MSILFSIIQFMIDKLKIMWLISDCEEYSNTPTYVILDLYKFDFTWMFAGRCKLEKNRGNVFCIQ